MTRGTTEDAATWLVVSDLDGTLLGKPEATNRFREWWRSLSVPPRLVYASGRYYSSVVASIRETGLPHPDAVIADVGTDVRMYPTGVPLVDWASRWWTAWMIEEIESIIDSEFHLEPQPSHCQSAFKRSYFVRNAQSGWLNKTRQRLRERLLAVDLVYSSNRDLDILPEGANKGTAVEFLAQMWKIPRSRVLVAGDSGNDLSMFVQGFRGVVVANAQMELNQLGGPNVYRSMEEFADGVIDGLKYWLSRHSSNSA